MEKDRLDRALAFWYEWLVLVTVMFYAFLVYAFYRNGLHRFTIEQIGSPAAAGAGSFPFDSHWIGFLIIPALLIVWLGPVVVPLLAIGLAGSLAYRWRSLTWPERGLSMLMLPGVLGVLAVMRSHLGRSIAAWIFD